MNVHRKGKSMKYEDRVRELMEIIESGTSKEDIRAGAIQIKQAMSEEASALFLAITAIDSLIDVFAPAPPSEYNRGWLPVPVPGAEPAPPTLGGKLISAGRRSEKVIEVARRLAEQSGGLVSGKEVAEHLSREEGKINTRAFGISVSNVLARAVEFETVSPGEYRLREGQSLHA